MRPSFGHEIVEEEVEFNAEPQSRGAAEEHRTIRTHPAGERRRRMRTVSSPLFSASLRLCASALTAFLGLFEERPPGRLKAPSPLACAMARFTRPVARFGLLIFFLGNASPGFASARAEGLSAAEITLKVVERAQQTLRNPDRGRYAYTKVSVREELDKKGKVKERHEKVIQFGPRSARVARMKVNDQVVGEAELKKRVAQGDPGVAPAGRSFATTRDDAWQRSLTRELIAKYDFILLEPESLQGRPAYVMAFRPKNGRLSENQWSDRLLNRLAGKLWIDQEDFEIAKADLSLQSEITVGLGLLGALKKFDFVLERVRLPEGVWFNRSSRADLVSRKLFDSSHVKTWSELKDFRRITAAP